MMAIAATRTPGRIVATGPYATKTYKWVLQRNVSFFAWSQNPDGAWRYKAVPQASDQSNTGYAVLGLRYAEAAEYGFGCTINASIKSGLMNWISFIQCGVAGPNFGGSGYVAPCSWVNCLKTGNLLFEMAFCGIPTDNQSVKDAISYIENHWDDAGGCGTGWASPPHFQAMYCLMKGLESMGTDNLTVTRGSENVTIDWFDEMSTVIVESQDNVTGCWPADCWGNSQLGTVWALLTLEKVAPPPPEIPVPVDIKPTSCPNPLNVNGKGVLPVAILGTEDFDVTTVNMSTLALMGVPALRCALEDVATPYGEPFNEPPDCLDCTEEGPDGYLDLTIKFDMQAIVAALGDVSDGDCLMVELTGNLKEEFNGTAIIGADVVRIIKKK
jgi:hypothetical protein